MRRELALVLGARATWAVLAIGAWLVGHSFVLAMDLFTAASRSVTAGTLMSREMDPLAGVVRPTLGGLHLAVALLLPVIAARGLAIEKERHGWGALVVATGGSDRVVLRKAAAALVAGALMIVPVLTVLTGFVAVGGVLDLVETATACAGHALHVAVIALVSVAAAAGTRTVAQATTLGILVSIGSWAMQAGDGFAALAWMGRFEGLSIDHQLTPFELGVLPIGGLAYFVILGGASLALALVLARFDRARAKAGRAIGIFVVACGLLAAAAATHRAYDWSEQRRASLPPPVVDALRAIDEPITIDVWLDRDDGRRAHVERDALGKLRLARPDLVVTYPMDALGGALAVRDEDYGRLVIHVGDRSVETRSTARRELATLMFELAERPMPDFGQPPYAGHPRVVEGARRTALVASAYLVLPLSFVLAGWLVTRKRRRSR